MTSGELQELVDQCGSIDAAAHAAGIPRDEFRERCQRLGIRASRPAARAHKTPAHETLDLLSAYLERVGDYAEQMEELFMYTGFSGFRVHGEMTSLDTSLASTARPAIALPSKQSNLPNRNTTSSSGSSGHSGRGSNTESHRRHDSDPCPVGGG